MTHCWMQCCREETLHCVLCQITTRGEVDGGWLGVEGVDEGKMTYCWMLTPAILIQERGEGVQTQIHKYKYNQLWAGDRDLEKMLLEIRIKQISSQSTIRGWQEVEQQWVEFSFSTVRVSTEWRRKSVDLCFMSFMHRGGEDRGNFSPTSIHWMRPVLGFWGNEWSIRTIVWSPE